jgi:hypothetical protein
MEPQEKGNSVLRVQHVQCTASSSAFVITLHYITLHAPLNQEW